MKRRDVLKATAALAAIPPFSSLALAKGEDGPDALRYVHPELRGAGIAVLEGMRRFGTTSLKTLPDLRKLYSDFVGQILPDIPFEMKVAPGFSGQPPVDLYVVNARRGAPGRPAILHTHGGGFIMGTARAGIPALQSLARDLDCVIVSVDYRLAPETSYKGSMADNYAGLKWLYAHADALGVDTSRIGVMGESAGGGHAALLAITARDRGEIPIAFQCLIYPMLDDRTGSSRQVPSFMGQLEWTATDNRLGWASFLGGEPGTLEVPAVAVPARTSRLDGLPPTFIAVGSIDLFTNEDIDYARRLSNAGVSTELLVLPGAFHGFDLYPQAANSSIVKHFNEARIAALRRGLQAG